jgi:hypothetical protein
VPDDDRVVAHQHLADKQAQDLLPFLDLQRVGGAAQTREERGQRLGQLHVVAAGSRLVRDRLAFRPDRLVALLQGGHALAQLVDR